MKILVSLSIALCFLGVSRAKALDLQRYEKLVVFGDSLSDDGNLFALTALIPPPPYGETFDGTNRKFPGRFTDGEIWVDYFPSVANHFPSLTAYFQDPLSPNGTDFAIGSATSADLLQSDPAGFPAEIPTYLTATGGSIPANNLYVVWIGANDFAAGVDPKATVQNILNGIARLQQAGAKAFVVIDVPDISLTPDVRNLGSSTVQEAKEFVLGVDVLLATELPLFALTHSITIDFVDVNGIFLPLVFNPRFFGFTNTVGAAFNPTTGALVSDPNDYLFWDGFHPTTNAHHIAAEYFYGVIASRFGFGVIP
jgi:phospholipase/lecithinase/hemolysin